MDNKKLDENVMEPKIEQGSETETNDTNQAVSESLQSSADNHEKADKSGVSWGFLFNLVCILLLTFATLGGGYYLYQELTKHKDSAQALAVELKQALNEPSRQISSLQSQQQAFSGSINQQMQGLSESQTQLNERVAKLAQRNPNHWMAEEAKYLVRMAGSKLWLEKDPSTAASLLKSADARIESMKDPSLTPLRKALAQDISVVSAIKSTDIAGTVLTLDSMIELLDRLPLNRVEVANAANRLESPEMSASIDDWKENLAKSWKSIMDDFVVVRKRTTDITPILAPDQQWYLVENIRNKLLQSQLALYRQDQVNYRQSLTLARKWIYQYFDLNDAKTKETLSALEALKTLEIQTPTINHFQSTALLQQLVIHGNLLVTEEASL
ncbi:uroporphyrinogen-III methylase [Shewanella canadensis]|uniref:Uroporphyrinogen-III methylase n=1 Tax=Shewanella canadensis TaxID=271096 RepID=A0A431WKP6_9GAMM|nr:uroporphyrinogen-III C-methyltransferase [Shewanella canadensis]RTR35949.1 uroporphyrinogen-III methylase [Shewanella canadensis]